MKSIVGFSRYKIDESGNVVSLFLPIKGGVSLRKEEKMMSCWFNKDGYAMVSIVNDFGRKIHKSIHRLVADNFIENINNSPLVCHKDSNIKNNHVSNLYWGTIKENIRDEISRGTHSSGWNKRCLVYSFS